jgi:Family of unknown function (DUF5694)
MINSKKISLLFTFCLTMVIAQAQIIKNPDEFLLPNGKDSLPKIFLVGSFHFEYYNKDAVKVGKDKQVDILSEQKQKELKELLDYIAIFKPTKICIEAPVRWGAMKKYRDYKSGKKPLEKDEVQQIGFRLMEKFNLDTAYCIDAGTIADDLSESKDSTTFKPYIDSIFNNYTFKNSENYKKWQTYYTELGLTISLKEYFKYINSPQCLQRDYGSYLIGDFKNGSYNGADALATYWYDRNLRIYRNIQKMTTSKNDRILVLFGSGHIAVLDQLLKCSPEYDYIKFNDLKK